MRSGAEPAGSTGTVTLRSVNARTSYRDAYASPAAAAPSAPRGQAIGRMGTQPSQHPGERMAPWLTSRTVSAPTSPPR